MVSSFSKGFQSSVKSAYPGWTVQQHPGTNRIRVRIRKAGVFGDGQSVLLPILWEAKNQAEAMGYIGRMYKQVETGEVTLKGSLEVVMGASDLRAEEVLSSWNEIVLAYRIHLQTFKNRIKESTYEASYGRYFTEALKLLHSRKPPTNGYELLERTLKVDRKNQKPGKKFGHPLKRWVDLPASRIECSLAIKNLLQYAVSRHPQPQSWILNEFDYEELRGKKPKSRVKAILNDFEILNLVNVIEDMNPHWANAIKLLALYGLRPVELQHLSVKRNPHGDWQLWCDYQKTVNGKKTAPRWLLPVPLVDPLGKRVQWDLVLGFNAIELPLGLNGQKRKLDGAVLGKFLRSLPQWQFLVKAKSDQGEYLKPYAFRDSYSLRAHRFGVSTEMLSPAMGHSVEIHSRSYRTSGFDEMMKSFKIALEL